MPKIHTKEFPWFYDDARASYGWGGSGQAIKSLQVTTDASGRATVRFDTPNTGRNDGVRAGRCFSVM